MDDETAKRINKQFKEMVKNAGPWKNSLIKDKDYVFDLIKDKDYVFDWKILHGKNLLISVGVDEGYSESILVTGTDLETGISYTLHQDIKKST